jgi:hypothetical protein
MRTIELPDPTLLESATSLLPTGDYVCGAHLGPARANRKPVLAVATPAGELVAFVKWGVNDLTDALVQREADALDTISGLRTVDVPGLIGVVEHGGHPAVVQSPVRRARRTPSTDVVTRAQAEVAAIGATTIDPHVALHSWVNIWNERATRAHDEVTEEFATLARGWAVEAESAGLPWGAWHGDWRRTNMDASDRGCAVWDWERFDIGVPAGYDALHLFLTTHAATVTDLATLPAAVRQHAPRLLEPFGVMPESAELVARGYLLEVAGRYLDDRQSAAGARLGAVDQWLLPFLRSAAGQHRTRGTSV